MYTERIVYTSQALFLWLVDMRPIIQYIDVRSKGYPT